MAVPPDIVGSKNETYHRDTENTEKEREGDMNSPLFCVLSAISAPLRWKI